MEVGKQIVRPGNPRLPTEHCHVSHKILSAVAQLLSSMHPKSEGHELWWTSQRLFSAFQLYSALKDYGRVALAITLNQLITTT